MTELETHQLIREQLQARVVDLERKKSAREGQPGLTENVTKIAQVIEVLNGEIESRDAAIAELEAEEIDVDMTDALGEDAPQ